MGLHPNEDVYTESNAERRVNIWKTYLKEYETTGYMVSKAKSYIDKWNNYKTNQNSNRDWKYNIKRRKKVALIIGIDKYKYHRQLSNAVADAKAVALALGKHYGYELIELYDENATEQNIISTARKIVNEIQDGNLLIYYAGHGWFDNNFDEGYWIPVDAQEDKDSDYIANAYLHKIIGSMEKAQHIFIVADSCFSGSFIKRGKVIHHRHDDNQNNFFSKMDNRQSRVVLTSGANEPVPDGGRDGHSVFAYYFLRALTNPDDAIFSTADLSLRVKKSVGNNADQTPLSGYLDDAGHEEGEMVFIKEER